MALETIELILDETTDLSGVEAISLVESPAIEEDFVALKNHKVEFKTIDEEKRIVIGLALVPDKLIYRRDGDREYNIFFSKKTVKDVAHKWIMDNNNNNATLEHELTVSGVNFVETWIVEDPSTDKTKLYGLNAVEGAWAVIGKIENDDVWADVKAKRYKGLSIEGYFADKLDPPMQGIVEKNLCKDCFEELQAEYSLLELLSALEEEVELESYGGYPDSASNNAKLGIERNKELGNKCATQVGKVRAQQLARKEKFTVPTLKRIYSYLSRAEAYYDPAKPEACGTISYLLWGGKSMKNWVESKLRGLDELSDVELEVNPCQEGYEMVGFKEKDGRKVPNCVPKNG
jgi:hypothetical protein